MKPRKIVARNKPSTKTFIIAPSDCRWAAEIPKARMAPRRSPDVAMIAQTQQQLCGFHPWGSCKGTMLPRQLDDICQNAGRRVWIVADCRLLFSAQGFHGIDGRRAA